MKFEIYQMKRDEKYHGLRFIGLKDVQEQNIKLSVADYDHKYTGEYKNAENKSTNEILEDIFCEFNINKPEDFQGHSLSVSDVIVLTNENETVYYVDGMGFKEMPDFFKEEENDTE